MRLWASSLLIGALLLVACDGRASVPPSELRSTAAGSPLKPALVMMEKHFAVVAPSDGFSLVQTTKDGLDFQLFEVRRAGLSYARIYLGNAPSFPKEAVAQGDGRQKAVSAGLNGAKLDQYLVPNAERWPRFIQAMALEVPDNQDLANQIAAGVGPIPSRP